MDSAGKLSLFAPELIQQMDTPGQELGSHFLSHYYTFDAGAHKKKSRTIQGRLESYSADCFGEIQLPNWNRRFSRNHINELYLKICFGGRYQQLRGKSQKIVFGRKNAAWRFE